MLQMTNGSLGPSPKPQPVGGRGWGTHGEACLTEEPEVREPIIGLPHPRFDTFAVILDCSSLLQDKIGSCDVWAVLFLDAGGGSAERTVPEGEVWEHCIPHHGRAADTVRVHSIRTGGHTESGCKYLLSAY